MKPYQKALMWLWLLTKRLYKRPAFLVILMLIPALVLGYTAMTRDDSGVVTVALAQEEEDPLATHIFQQLSGNGQMIRYVFCPDPEEAETLVRGGKADMAWIFPKDLKTRIDAFVDDPDDDNSFVLVLLREDTVTTMLARERLSGVLYEQIAKSYYLCYMRENFPELDHLSDEALMAYYNDFSPEGKLFTIEDAANGTDHLQTVHYLLSPVRGLLGILTVLCGLAAAMFHMRDLQLGTFSWVSLRMRPAAELVNHLVSVLNVGLVAFVTLLLTDLAADPVREFLILLLYCLCIVSFCMVLRRLTGSIKLLGTLTPLLIVIMLLVCPVFFDFRPLRWLQLFLPPTYYINAAYKPAYILYMPVYILTGSGVYLLLGKLLKKP